MSKRNRPNGVSATELRNYFMNDPILDWFKYHGEKNGYEKDKYENSYSVFCMNRGIEFENVVMNDIKKLNFSIIDIKEKYQNFCPDGVKDTIECMKNGVDIIYQGFLADDTLDIYGIPDLLVRSDILSQIFQNTPEIIEPTNKEFKWSYFVVDIKFSTLSIGQKNNILNGGSMRAYKAQLFIYNQILDNLFYVEEDRFKQSKAFLLSRRIIIKKDILNGTKILGEIDFNEEKYGEQVENALEWIRLVRQNENVKVKPNMKNRNDYPWHNAKKLLSEKQKDLTRIWNVSSKIRDKIEKGKEVNKCFRCESKSKIVESMIKVDSDGEMDEGNEYEISLFGDKMNFYVDFEYINGCDFSFDHNTKTYIYMIGVGYYDKKWVYKVFMPEYLNDREEKRMIYDWINYMKNISKNNYQIIHWTHAERSLYKKKREEMKLRVDLNWIDLQPYVRDSGIVFVGMTNYGLKTVAKSMKSMGLIETDWDDNITDGLGANMIVINGMKDKCKVREMRNMDIVIRYNEVDCRVMFEILGYLSNRLKKNI